MTTRIYKAKNKVRIVTAASLFDGHDAAINMIRRILQYSGAEVIHLGHDRSVQEIVNCAIQENVQGIAITSYQGGHMEFFKYMYDLLQERGHPEIKLFGGGGGVILPQEIEELHAHGITRIYSPDDGRTMGLQGMINDVMEQCDFKVPTERPCPLEDLRPEMHGMIARWISSFENNMDYAQQHHTQLDAMAERSEAPVLGITGTGGAGKSSLVDELVRRFTAQFPDKHMAIISVDPSKRRSGGALLGDRIRMNAIDTPHVYMRSLATRQSNLALSAFVKESVQVVKAAGFDLIVLETSGIGQSDTEIVDHSDLSLYVMTPEYGAASQLEKIDMLDFADFIALNKFDKNGALDALRDIRKQYQRNHLLFEQPLEQMPVYGTMASQFNDAGVNTLYHDLIYHIGENINPAFKTNEDKEMVSEERIEIIPPKRIRYLSEISDENRRYLKQCKAYAEVAGKIQSLQSSIHCLKEDQEQERESLESLLKHYKDELPNYLLEQLEKWEDYIGQYQNEYYIYKVRGKEVKVATHHESLSHLKIPKIAVPSYHSWYDRLLWVMKENFPGKFPYAAGVFPFKREQEDPTRMFAGEGNPERTNKRFHYLSRDQYAKRLSTAYDSVTLYGRNPDTRPDIYGKIGNSGVSVCSLDDSKKLYAGFDLCDPKTSVSMTINGPAPTLTAFFLNTAIDQECEKWARAEGMADEIHEKINRFYAERDIERPKFMGEMVDGQDKLGLLFLGMPADRLLPAEVYQRIRKEAISKVRGTVQADILKEDQAQNTCIFSTEFSLMMMGDMQSWFIDNHVKNFYSVSISGYHIAEAGANPITQLAFTLANGFTYVEYYLARGMHIDDFAPNLSFFFSNGIDAEYAVMGRVARLIWAKAMKHVYGASDKSQKLKYHIQTSGRSLHAQEIDFNDIRTTLQALYAIYDNCNSLHTNAYDEAITTPTEDSVRRAMAIQLIINRELGMAKNQNPLQGSFIVDELTHLVEEAVLSEFDRITDRGGVIGAMESMYQRGKIQEESMLYEQRKHSGDLPIIGVNTFLSSKGSPTILPKEVIRATVEEKENQIKQINNLQLTFVKEAENQLKELRNKALCHENLFESLMEVSKYCSLGQITDCLFAVGGQYRRNM